VADLGATRVTSPANALTVHIDVLMVFFQLEISPFTSTVICVTGRARHRGRDFGNVADLRGQIGCQQIDVVGQILPVPPTPGTTAWPPSLPSVPTSRATRVTSAAKSEAARPSYSGCP